MAYIDHIRHGFSSIQKNGLLLLTVPAIEETGRYRHAFTTRKGGVSEGCYAALNLSLTREENRANVRKNYELLAGALQLDLHSFTVCHYEHGANICTITDETIGAVIVKENNLPFCDGVVIRDRGATAVTLHADCMPLFFADKQGRVAGVCHAGWKGTLSAISLSMMRELGIPAADILVGIGPTIGPCCFEVKDDVSSLFLEKYGASICQHRGERQFIDLPSVALLQLESAGIPPENVTASGLCTACDAGLFFSHRRDRGNTGAMASIIAFQ